MHQLKANNGRGDYDSRAGISVKFMHPDRKDITICYNGLLAKSGATQVYLHTGIGSYWDNVYDHRMERSANGWEKTIQMERSNINFCFKDSACNWDNNNGQNWCFNLVD
ncbi:Carbohydrate binding domain (family 25) [Sporotomaculum syntrophicum]|uniref:Carbohydrate binding domain (Family 25) n=1 Tax=Sporotomaculum syntrophicum TaxID=182264 RepID=A0A9D2WRW2_9FIRM|nr:carbohydrate-binding protein [Sporotomaculum syntrophicum]KAF1086239.1 Carbohydrate binding domain (family 25) [Sporotomaculum syntrophicum]